MRRTFLFSFLAACFLAQIGHARESIRLASEPALSPDGKTIAFVWRGDLWSVPTAGGTAKQLTTHVAKDRLPKFSPDGSQIAFVSEREGAPQLFTMPAAGGTPKQLTFHTSGFLLEGWYPDGTELLATGRRDYSWNPRLGNRFLKVSAKERSAEQLLFDTYGTEGSLSPDGKRLLFCREGEQWFRKGYRGSQASQIWLADLATGAFTCVLKTDGSCRTPLWKPDGKGFYFVGQQGTAANLFDYNLGSSEYHPLTQFADDAVRNPTLSKDGSTLAFVHLFDLYSFRPGDKPAKIDVAFDGDAAPTGIDRKTLTQATDAAFTADGLEIAFVAGGDLWVMDTELREPKRVTTSVEDDRSPVFSPDGESLVFVSEAGGQCDLWKAERADASKYWWQNDHFKLTKLTNDAEVEGAPQFRPDGKAIAFVKGRGDLWTMNLDGKDSKRILTGFDRPDFDWAPDGKWMVVAQSDNDFNRDVWILSLEGKAKPFNLSKSPGNDSDPVWSPDGKAIAWIARRRTSRNEVESEVAYAYLRLEDQQQEKRDRTLEQAIEKMKKGRRAKSDNPPSAPAKRGDGSKKNVDPAKKTAAPPKPDDAEQQPPRRRGGRPDPAPAATPAATPGSTPPGGGGLTISGGDAPKRPVNPTVTIDFDGLHERIQRVAVEGMNPSEPFWSPDSKKLAFTGTLENKRGTLYIELPDDPKPKVLNAATGSRSRWLDSNQIVWLTSGTPANLSLAGKATSYAFRAIQEVDLRKKHRAAFDVAWRIMRDNWYDGRLGNRDWNAVRTKYSAMAETPDADSLALLCNLMLGELNGSHLGFTLRSGNAPAGPPAPPGPTPEPAAAGGSWQPVTPHFGLRFDPKFAGPGLKVKDVLRDGPADRKRSRIVAGEIVRQIDGKPVDAKADLSIFNGTLDREIPLVVANAKGETRTVLIRPISYAATTPLLYEQWIRDTRKAVEGASLGRLGYLYIRAMDQNSFNKLEEELCSVGSGKEGLIIDVRENGGGSTADHLLTVLCQPKHAFTVPRGGGQGYPGDRIIYATWSKPIIVLCNQNSFSNAEIFSHAIRNLKRGKVVGVPTAGGVVSTGAAPVMDVGQVRLPFRGWFDPTTGEDMELRGATPDVVMWPEPADQIAGKDAQLLKAVELLLSDCDAEAKRQKPKPRYATERGGKPAVAAGGQ